jgi:hypothetical protein
MFADGPFGPARARVFFPAALTWLAMAAPLWAQNTTAQPAAPTTPPAAMPTPVDAPAPTPAPGLRRGLGPRGAQPAIPPLPASQMNALVIIEGDQGRGSGFVAKIHDKFFVVTNLHVLSGQSNFTITGLDGTKLPANGQLFGSMDYDAAILSIPAPKYYLELLDEVNLTTQTDDLVTVPGNASGMGVATQTNGKLLGIGPKLVEVDAKFVKGNSGSPIIHRPSGKVIGMATFTMTYRLADLKLASSGLETRWFGYRLDNATRWELLDRQKFAAEGEGLRKIEATTNALIALLKGTGSGLTFDDLQVKSAYSTFTRERDLAVAHNSEKELQYAVQHFANSLGLITDAELKRYLAQDLYAFHASEAQKQLEIRKQIQNVMQNSFATVARSIGSGTP